MYRQVKGTAMGPDFAPPYACLTIGFLEETKMFNSLKQVLNNEDYERLNKQNLKRIKHPQKLGKESCSKFSRWKMWSISRIWAPSHQA